MGYKDLFKKDIKEESTHLIGTAKGKICTISDGI